MLWWRKKSTNSGSLARAVVSMTEGDGPDPRAEEVARGTALLDEVEASELGPLAKLPPFRPVILSLLRLFDREQVSNEEIARLVESDTALTAELLAVVNSPLFSVPAPVTSSLQAVSLLGHETTKSLAAALGMRSMVKGAPRTPVIRRFWIHTVAAATIAQDFAPCFRLNPQLAYVGAVLHDVGRLGLLVAYPEEYTLLALSSHASAEAILAAEEAAVGMTHCRAGSLLASSWRLPNPATAIAEHHHNPGTDRDAVALVHLACRLADDFQFQAIQRRDIQKPETTIKRIVPVDLQDQLINRLEEVNTAIVRGIESLDF
jgi:HD-like signal output (HDOD) protein